MNNIQHMLKAQELIYSNTDKLESIITAIESVLNPIMGEGNTVVAPEEEKAPKRWWEDYTWGEKDVGSLFSFENAILKADAFHGDGVIDIEGYEFGDYCIERYEEDIKLHFKPWIAEKGKVPLELASYFAVLFSDGTIRVFIKPETNLIDAFGVINDDYDYEAVGYCNLTFVNPILGE